MGIAPALARRPALVASVLGAEPGRSAETVRLPMHSEVRRAADVVRALLRASVLRAGRGGSDAAAAIWQAAPDRLQPLLIDCLADPSPRVRTRAVPRLTGRGTESPGPR